MNTASLLLGQVSVRPDAPALIETIGGRDQVLTFADLDEQSGRVAALLHQKGLHSGQTALVFVPMSLDLYIVLVALFRLGVVAMFLDPSAGTAHIRACCALHAPDAFIGTVKAHLLRLVSPALRRIPLKISVGGVPVPGATRQTDSGRRTPFTMIVPAVENTPALMTFTSGSTGQPKAAVRTHGLLAAQHRSLAASLHLQPGEIDLTTLPIFALANLASGVTSVIPTGDLRRPGAVNVPPIRAQILRLRPTRAAASPAFFERLLESGEPLPSLRHIYTGGAPVFPGLLDSLTMATEPEAEIVAVYGSTEAEPIAHIARAEMSDNDISAMGSGKGLLAGLPVPDIALGILPDAWGTPLGPFTPDAFDDLCLPADQPGEIVVSGDHVLPGYLNGQGDAETKFRVGNTIWHRTGDEGYLDDTGRLWLLGRCGARIEDDRGILYPFAVECAARRDPAVRRVAVVSHKNRRLLLVEGGNIDTNALRTALHWAILDEVRVWDTLPVDKRHNAKIDYPALHHRLDRER
ncbi:MAG: AMP-binding protein [Akkermansiaceae bacterium]|nr:AMP-binding protein [Armatimonadota bacterium]